MWSVIWGHAYLSLIRGGEHYSLENNIPHIHGGIVFTTTGSNLLDDDPYQVFFSLLEHVHFGRAARRGEDRAAMVLQGHWTRDRG